MTELERFTRRKITALLEKYRIEDDSLETELIEACWAVRSFQPTKPEEPTDPRIMLVESISGRKVPTDARPAVLKMFGDYKEPELRKAWQDWNMKGRDPNNWTWISWAAHVGKVPGKAAGQPEQQPRGFSGLQEWMTTNGQD